MIRHNAQCVQTRVISLVSMEQFILETTSIIQRPKNRGVL